MIIMRDPNAIIYSDSDGVICDFYSGAERVFGRPWGLRHVDSQTNLSQGEELNGVPGFWETLPPMPDWKVYWAHIEKYSPHILTAVPSWKHDFTEVYEGKWQWYQKNIPSLPNSRFHVVVREEKSNFALNGQVRNILIDDHPANVKAFEEAGGIGIYHVSAKLTILKLKELGYH